MPEPQQHSHSRFLPLLLPTLSTALAPAKVTVVHAAHMLDGVSKEMQGPVSVTITGGRITDVKPGIAKSGRRRGNRTRGCDAAAGID